MSDPGPLDGRLVVGRYRLGRLLGRGGMGSVWAATDQVLGREVALKEVRPSSDLAPEQRDLIRQRTMREARAAARVSHPAAVTVYDVVEEEGRPWIVMQLLATDSLADVLAQSGPLSAKAAARIGVDLVDALRAADRAGVLHRDVKPANVMLFEDGSAVLTDFGIATVADDPTLTATGMMVGSAEYMSPERARGEQPTPASDLWSLGATLYAAVEGRSPFRRDGQLSTLTAVVNEPLPPPVHAGPLEPVIAQLLAKDPEQRPDAARTRLLLLQARAASDDDGAEASPTPAPLAPPPPRPTQPDIDPFAVWKPALPVPLEPITNRAEPPADQAKSSVEPAEPTPGPPDPTPGPPEPVADRAESPADQVEPTPDQVEPTPGLPEPVTGRAESPADQTEPRADPPEPIAVRVESPADQVESSVEPAEPVADRATDQTEPPAPPAAPAERPADLAEPATDRAEPAPDLSEPATDRADPITDPAESPAGPAESPADPAESPAEPSRPVAKSDPAPTPTPPPIPTPVSTPTPPPSVRPSLPSHQAPIGLPAQNRRRQLPLAVGLAILVLAVVVGALTLRPDGFDRQSASPTQTTQPQSVPSNTGSPQDSASAAATPSSADTTPSSVGVSSTTARATGAPSASTGSGRGANAVPVGFRSHRDATGFKVAVPRGWTRSVRGNSVYFRAPSGPSYLQVDTTKQPKPDALADWKKQERSIARRFEGYQRIRLEAIDYRGWNAADWEFTWRPGNGTLHVLNRNIRVSDKRAYALYWSIPSGDWQDRKADFQVIADTFEPAP